jgi:hypothetical protein
MLNGARGSLFLIDRKRGQIFTVSGTSVKRLNLSAGVIGYTARSGESVLCDLFNDPRYDESIDDLTVNAEYLSQNSKVIIGVRGGQGGGGRDGGDNGRMSAQHMSPRASIYTPPSTLLLSVPVRNCEGVVIGVLAAVHSSEISYGYGGSKNRKEFSNEDGLILTLMGSFVASNVEKVSAKRVLTQATHNLVACENTLRSAILSGGDRENNSNSYYFNDRNSSGYRDISRHEK